MAGIRSEENREVLFCRLSRILEKMSNVKFLRAYLEKHKKCRGFAGF